VDPIIKKSVVFSVPLDLKTSCEKISAPSNWIYANRFIKSLKKKVIAKAAVMPTIDITGIHAIKTLKEFDDRYTAPMHGFKDAYHYYSKCSSIGFVNNITTPTLIVNAQNDPFLSKECFPDVLLKDHPYVRLESPLHGGHVGFIQLRKNGLYWSEEQAIDFITHDRTV
jgi:predicted alpha/beta-fold hydrolase